MSAWPFLLFALIFAFFVYAHFLLAYRSWRASRGERANDIDQHYIRLEDYAARSFRAKVSEWLRMPHLASKSDGTRRIRKGSETILVTGVSEYPPQTISDEILIVHGAFRCLAGCTFHREIYAWEDAVIGAGTHLQAVASDGNLLLGPKVRVARWADCRGKMEIGSDSIIAYRATAGVEIRLHGNIRVKSVFAPLVRSGDIGPEEQVTWETEPGPMFEFPLPDFSGAQLRDYGLDPDNFSRLDQESWIYHGDLKLSTPLHLRNTLVVRGSCVVPPGSILDKDIKCKESLSVGKDSVCRGNLIADGNIRIGRSCRFHGILHACGQIYISEGVCGGDAETPVAVFAEDTVTVGKNVTVYGKLSSGAYVEIMPGAGGHRTDSELSGP